MSECDPVIGEHGSQSAAHFLTAGDGRIDIRDLNGEVRHHRILRSEGIQARCRAIRCALYDCVGLAWIFRLCMYRLHCLDGLVSSIQEQGKPGTLPHESGGSTSESTPKHGTEDEAVEGFQGFTHIVPLHTVPGQGVISAIRQLIDHQIEEVPPSLPGGCSLR